MSIHIAQPAPNPYAGIFEAIGGAMRQNALQRELAKGSDILSKFGDTTTTDAAKYAQKYAGLTDMDKDQREILGNNSKSYNDYQTQMDAFRQQLEGADDATKQVLNLQINDVAKAQQALHADSEKRRIILGLKNVDLKGYGKDENAADTWSQYKTPPIVEKTPGLLGTNSLDTAKTDQSQQYRITAEDLLKHPEIAAEANKLALKDASDKFNLGDYRNKITTDLIKAGIRPEVLASLQGRIDEQARNMGMKYAMSQEGVDKGDYSKAATWAIQHGMGEDVLKLFGNVANKYATNGINAGGKNYQIAIGGSPYGAVPTTSVIGEITNTLSPRDVQEGKEFDLKLAFDKDKFNKEYDLQKQNFGENKALQWAQYQLADKKLTLEQKEHVAGKIRAGIEVIKTENDNLMKQLVEVNKNVISTPTTAQQYEMDSLKSRIAENNLNLAKYGSAVDDSLGIKSSNTKQSATKQENSLISIKKSDYNPLYNKLREKDFSDDEAREYLRTHYNIVD